MGGASAPRLILRASAKFMRPRIFRRLQKNNFPRARSSAHRLFAGMKFKFIRLLLANRQFIIRMMEACAYHHKPAEMRKEETVYVTQRRKACGMGRCIRVSLRRIPFGRFERLS